MAQFIERRRRELVGLGRDAEAAAHEAYRRTIRAGENLKLATPGDVVAYGRGLLQGTTPQAATKARPSPKPQQKAARPAVASQPVSSVGRTPPSGHSDQAGSWLNRSPEAKAIGGDLARKFGNVAGLASGAFEGVKGLGEGAVFVSRLLDPGDAFKSPPGRSAASQLVGAGRDTFDYMKQGIADPQKVLRDIGDKAHQMRVELDPTATPVADTFSGELRRSFDIGQNQGEVAFEVGSLAVGGPAAKAVGKLGVASNVGRAEKYLAQGFKPEVAAHLAEPYKGMGHHFGPRRLKLPRPYSESLFNVLKPEGMSRGDFYELHYRVDPEFNHARLPARLGGGSWKGKGLGLEKYGLPGRIWYGSPAPLKARTAGAVGIGGLVHDGASGGESR